MLCCVASRGTPMETKLYARPPWYSLNPLWVPQVLGKKAPYKYNIWWMYAWQKRDQPGTHIVGMVAVAVLLAVASLSCFAATVRVMVRSRAAKTDEAQVTSLASSSADDTR